MADEPNPKVDRLLRDYAGERRKHADVPLHPATRKMLQGEVSRTFRGAAPGRIWTRWRAFLPQIAFGSGVAVVLVIAVLSLRNRPTALNDRALDLGPAVEQKRVSDAEASSSEQPLMDAGQDSAGVAPALGENEALVRQDAPAEERALAKSLSASAEAPQPAPSAPEARGELQENSRRAPSGQKKEAIQPARQTVSVDKLARADNLTNLGAAIRLQFVELPDRSRRDGPPPILASFQVEQSGDELRIYDKDGSIYSGQIFSNTGEQSVDLSLSLAKDSAAAQPLPNASERFFSVQGTNRTLAKSVLVQGNFFEQTNTVPPPERTLSFSAGVGQPASNVAKFRRAIVGQAMIGQTNQIPVSAISVDP